MTSAERHEFGDVTVDLRRVEVRRAGQVVPLEPKSFDVLRMLIENRDRLVTKDELLDAVWKDTFVTPNVLTRAVAQLRKALGDDAHEARYIETVAKRGYRFIALVQASGNGLPALAPVEPGEAPASRDTVAGPRRGRWAIAAAAVLAAAMAVVVYRARPAAAPDRPGDTASSLRRLTSGRDSYDTPAISPDGSAVAYLSRRTGRSEIVVAGLAPGSREVIITSDGGSNSHPAFSPDGQWLAYHSVTRRGVWVVPSTGGTPRQVADFGSSPSWSPDGRRIVFTSNTGALSSQGELWTVGLDGSPAVSLTRPGQPPGGHHAPSWSHDGRLIAFRVGRHQANEIWTVDPRGGAPRLMATISRWAEPRFAPDDRALFWVASTPDGNDGLMRLRLDEQGNPVGATETVFRFQGEGIERLSIARNGTAVFLWIRHSVNLVAVDVGDGTASAPPVALTADEDVFNAYPAYSSTGRIAFEQKAAGRPVGIWVMDEDGRNKELVSAGLPASIRYPQWDEAGRRLFVVVQPAGDEPLYLGWIDVATRRLTRIPTAAWGRDNLPRTSPDGRRVAFHRVAGDGALNVWVQALEGGPARQVTFDREAASYPFWSRDGKWLGVNLKRGDTSQVGVVPVEGGAVEALTAGPGIRWPYAFAPDDDRISFAVLERGGVPGNAFSVSRRTKEVKPLTRFTEGGARFPAWSPRGDRIVFSRNVQSRSLWTMRVPR